VSSPFSHCTLPSTFVQSLKSALQGLGVRHCMYTRHKWQEPILQRAGLDIINNSPLSNITFRGRVEEKLRASSSHSSAMVQKRQAGPGHQYLGTYHIHLRTPGRPRTMQPTSLLNSDLRGTSFKKQRQVVGMCLVLYIPIDSLIP